MLNLTPEEIGRLSPQERLALIELLWDSLDDSDLLVTPTQRAELERRLDSFEQDRAGAVNWDQLKTELARRCP
jgi:putative addiction module component (TIGR02574 family)